MFSCSLRTRAVHNSRRGNSVRLWTNNQLKSSSNQPDASFLNKKENNSPKSWQVSPPTHITQVSPMDVQKMSNSDIGSILWMSARHPSNIPTSETQIQCVYISIKVTALASATGCSTNIRNRHIPDKITTY